MLEIKNAIISVYDKSKLDCIADTLKSLNIKVYSTSKTYAYLQKLGVNVVEISSYTKFPELLDGRVKSLHPLIYCGLLANRNDPKHKKEMEEHNIDYIDLAIVDLYPFQEVSNNNLSYDETMEYIDIGGVGLIRATAKNHKNTVILIKEESIKAAAEELKNNSSKVSLEFSQKMAHQAFQYTSEYDRNISYWLFQQENNDNVSAADEKNSSCSLILPEYLDESFFDKKELRYGENYFQQAYLYQSKKPALWGFESVKQLQGKELSFNNLRDTWAVWSMMSELKMTVSNNQKLAIIVKHTNPCGVAVKLNLIDAYNTAKNADPVSQFGGIVALSGNVNLELAEVLKEAFIEVLICPGIDDDALAVLSKKVNMRVLTTPLITKYPKNSHEVVSNGSDLLVQTLDCKRPQKSDITWVTSGQITDDIVLDDLLFSFHVCKFVKSNAIVLSLGSQTIGIGAGQMSRIDSLNIAIAKANEWCAKNNTTLSANNVVIASDAFFPFTDVIDTLARMNIKYVIQPGGSKNDANVIHRANQIGVNMAFIKDERHFKH